MRPVAILTTPQPLGPSVAGFAITEWGRFSASAVGTMIDRRLFSAINVVSGDGIQFTYSLTFTSGG